MAAKVRRELGVGPGSVLEWREEGTEIVVRRRGRHSSEEIHELLFARGSARRRTLAELEAGRARYVKARQARR